ncbi:MAG: hypothetical protein BWK73_09280 [Thiothrix lacustris]|uniref:Uncharacterized protein n=1 Tax=Thiothrix lacustris TaxID=525917 RepID=A0A1Y1QV80_9GAMM|nr:MAG: hypothetical protein BWK73_09280 [Thiothrix lacustris]
MEIDNSEIKSENVVPFERKPQTMLENHKIKKPVNPKSSYCRHKSTKLDAENREIICCDCGSRVDAFDWIKATLEENARFWNERVALQKEIQKKQQQLDALKEEEARIKARLRNAKESLTKAESKTADRSVAEKHLNSLNALLSS